MSEARHTVAIGAFVVGALLIAISTVIFVLGSGFASDRTKAVMVFEGSVKGLTVGAPVALRGVEIGQVTDIELILDSETAELIMLVEAEFRSENVRRLGAGRESMTEELISRGLRAQLNTQSLLTGLLYIQLDLHPDSELILVEIDSPYLQIPTIPTDLERLTRKLDTIDFASVAGDAEAILAGLNKFVSSEDFQGLPTSLQRTLSSISHLGEQLGEQVESTGPRLNAALDSLGSTLDQTSEDLPQLAALLESNLQALSGAIVAFEDGMRQFQTLVDHDSGTVYELNRTLQELSRAGRALQLLGETLEEQPEALIRGRSAD